MRMSFITFRRNINIIRRNYDRKEKLKKIRAVYELAQKNKGEDRLTQADIKQAKKVLNYKEPKKAADYGKKKNAEEKQRWRNGYGT